MLKQKQVEKFANALRKEFPEIKLLMQFGSFVSGDFNKRISDVDFSNNKTKIRAIKFK